MKYILCVCLLNYYYHFIRIEFIIAFKSRGAIKYFMLTSLVSLFDISLVGRLVIEFMFNISLLFPLLPVSLSIHVRYENKANGIMDIQRSCCFNVFP